MPVHFYKIKFFKNIIYTEKLPIRSHYLFITFFLFQHQILAEQRGATPMETTRKVIRRLFSKTLACQFSLTGLGEKRAHTKVAFRDHVVSNHALGNIYQSVYCLVCLGSDINIQ